MEEYLFSIVKSVTAVVKHFPFYYAFGLILYWLIAPLFSYEALLIVDGMIFMSVVMVAFLIRLSYCVKLCIWHRLQCVLPLLPQGSAYLDKQVYEFGSYTATANTIAMILLFLLSLVNAYFVFMKPAVAAWRKRRSASYPRR